MPVGILSSRAAPGSDLGGVSATAAAAGWVMEAARRLTQGPAASQAWHTGPAAPVLCRTVAKASAKRGEADRDSSRDTSELGRFGYAQELRRRLGAFSSFAIGFSVISVLTGVTSTFGDAFGGGGPAGPGGGRPP